MKNEYLERLNALASRLPFHVDDVGAVNEVFNRWHGKRTGEDLKTLELWVYCRTQFYVLSKLVRDTQATSNDFDKLSSVVFNKVRTGMETVREPGRFANWVNVVCRNAYVNERKKERPRDELNTETLRDETTQPLLEVDRLRILHVIDLAIERLPPSLSGVARMKLLEGREYQHIVDETGLPIASVRTYTAKAIARLREDPQIRDIARDIIPGLFGTIETVENHTGELES